jgi:hypothetical protein
VVRGDGCGRGVPHGAVVTVRLRRCARLWVATGGAECEACEDPFPTIIKVTRFDLQRVHGCVVQ